MVRRGAVATIRVGRHRRIEVAGLRPAFADQPLRLALLDAITDGRLVPPRAADPDHPPPTYLELTGVVRRWVWEDEG